MQNWGVSEMGAAIKVRNTFQNIPVVYCYEDVQMIINPTIIAEPKIKSREDIS